MQVRSATWLIEEAVFGSINHFRQPSDRTHLHDFPDGCGIQ
jgi:hypothetical protein